MAQQTAVEWLLEKICNEILDNEFINKLSIEKTHLFNKISTQAKEMEKEHIIDSFVEGISMPYMDVIGERRLFVLPKDETMCAEQYYNETYNK